VQEEVYSVAGCGVRATYDCDVDGCYPEGPREKVTPGAVFGVLLVP
jgi:hypothetical protein